MDTRSRITGPFEYMQSILRRKFSLGLRSERGLGAGKKKPWSARFWSSFIEELNYTRSYRRWAQVLLLVLPLHPSGDNDRAVRETPPQVSRWSFLGFSLQVETSLFGGGFFCTTVKGCRLGLPLNCSGWRAVFVIKFAIA